MAHKSNARGSVQIVTTSSWWDAWIINFLSCWRKFFIGLNPWTCSNSQFNIASIVSMYINDRWFNFVNFAITLESCRRIQTSKIVMSIRFWITVLISPWSSISVNLVQSNIRCTFAHLHWFSISTMDILSKSLSPHDVNNCCTISFNFYCSISIAIIVMSVNLIFSRRN